MDITDYIVVDVETSGSPWDGRLLTLAAAWGNDATKYDSDAWLADDIPDMIWQMIADPGRVFVSHSKYDSRWLRMTGHEVTGPYHDTMKMGHTLNENQQLSLEAMARTYLDIQMDKRIVRRNNQVLFKCDDGTLVPIEEAPKFQLMDYCRRDTVTTADLYLHLLDQLTSSLWLDYWLDEEVPFTEVLLDMECRGIPINLDEAAQLKDELVVELAKQEGTLEEMIGYRINFGSADQLRNVLFTDLWQQESRIEITKEQRDCLRARCEHVKDNTTDEHAEPKGHDPEENLLEHFSFPSTLEVHKVGTKYATVSEYKPGLGLDATPPTEKTKKPSTKSADLAVQHGKEPFVQQLLEYRKIDKLIGTYLNNYPRFSHEGRLYGTFNQSGTVTGRLSSSSPNLENQPAHGELGHRIRHLFQGRLAVGDHSQLEPRLMAHFSSDPVLQDIYREGRDIYLVTAEYIFGRKVEKDEPERQLCKTLLLAMGYGAGDKQVAKVLALNGYPTTRDEAAAYLAHLESLYSVFFGWKRWIVREAKDKGYVKTLGGRIRRLRHSFADAAWKARSKGERQAVNSIIQGSAGDVMRRNMLDCVAYEPDLLMLNQIHDELMFGVSRTCNMNILEYVKETCENPGYDLSVPLVFEAAFCSTWADKGGESVAFPEDWDDGEDD